MPKNVSTSTASAKKAATKAAPAKNAVPAKSAGPAKKATPPAKKAGQPAAPPAKKAPAKKAVKKAPAKTSPTKATGGAPPVPEGTDWSPAELAEVRADLQAQLTELRDEYDKAIADLNDLQRTSNDGAGDDQADAGTKTFEREQEMSIAHNRLDLLTQIERALDRLDAGTYGRCESCGNPIAKARLQAFPSATLCVACKQREERR